jgi:hypothetical protein
VIAAFELDGPKQRPPGFKRQDGCGPEILFGSKQSEIHSQPEVAFNSVRIQVCRPGGRFDPGPVVVLSSLDGTIFLTQKKTRSSKPPRCLELLQSCNAQQLYASLHARFINSTAIKEVCHCYDSTDIICLLHHKQLVQPGESCPHVSLVLTTGFVPLLPNLLPQYFPASFDEAPSAGAEYVQ